MVKDLILLANTLDKKGFIKEADFVDALIKRAFGIQFASEKIFGDDEGRVFVAIEGPGGGSKIFYKSSGTGGLSEAGDWVVTNGLTIARGSLYYIKDPGKIPPKGSPLERVAKALAQMEKENGPIMPNDMIGLSLGASHPFTYSQIAKFNKWVEEVGAITTAARKTGWGLIGARYELSEEEAIELAKSLGLISEENAVS